MIIGIGLPRTGTRSLSAALEILGFRGSHHCEIIGTTRNRQPTDSYRIDNSFYRDLSDVDSNHTYIVTYRPYEEWRSSIFQYKQYEGPDIESYINSCVSVFSNQGISLLVFNIRDGWNPLCEFLKVPVPEIDFPKLS